MRLRARQLDTVACELDRRGEQLVPRQPAVALDASPRARRQPRARRTRPGRSGRVASSSLSPNPTSIACISPPRRRRRPRPGAATKKSASRVERSRARWTSMKPPAPGPVRKLSVTARRERRSDARVDGVPALGEHARTRLCGQRMTPGDGALHRPEPSHAAFGGRYVAQERRRLERVAERAADAGKAAAAPGAADAGRDDRDPDLAGEPLVDRRAEDDVRVVGGGLADHLRGLVHLVERQVVAACDREQDAAGAGDLGLDQRAPQRPLGGLAGAVLAGRRSRCPSAPSRSPS